MELGLPAGVGDELQIVCSKGERYAWAPELVRLGARLTNCNLHPAESSGVTGGRTSAELIWIVFAALPPARPCADLIRDRAVKKPSVCGQGSGHSALSGEDFARLGPLRRAVAPTPSSGTPTWIAAALFGSPATISFAAGDGAWCDPRLRIGVEQSDAGRLLRIGGNE